MRLLTAFYCVCLEEVAAADLSGAVAAEMDDHFA